MQAEASTTIIYNHKHFGSNESTFLDTVFILPNKVKPSSQIYCCFPEMEERTGKKPREANWKREGERQENNREGKGGEKGQKRSMEHFFFFLTVSVLHSIVNHSTFFVFIQKRKKEKKKSSRVRKDLQHSSCQLFKPQTHTHFPYRNQSFL